MLNFSLNLGVLIWELFTLGDQPYQDFGDKQLTEYLIYLGTGQRLPYPLYCDDQIYDIMKQCWQSNKNHRPKFAELIEQFETITEQLINKFSSTTVY